jgi:hypothetical protein
LQKVFQTATQIASVRNKVNTLAQIAFVVSITASDGHRTRTAERARFLVFLQRAFWVEDFESGDPFQGLHNRPQDSIAVPERMRNRAETTLLADLSDRVFECVRRNWLLEEQTDYMAAVRQRSFFPDDDLEISVARRASPLEFQRTFDGVMIGDAHHIELSFGRPYQPIELDVAVMGVHRVTMQLHPQLC